MADFGFGLGLPLAAMLMASASPAVLYANGEQGVWISPSDITTLYQDSLGTTPVTAFGQPVGLVLDKSKSMMLGPELIAGSWTLTVAGTATATELPAGQLNLTGDGTNQARADMSIATVIGATYVITHSVSGNTLTLGVGTSQGNTSIYSAITLFGTNSVTFVATTTTTWLRFFRTPAGTAVVTTISARQVTHLGSERITNGAFPTDLTGWVTAHTNASTVNIVAGVATWVTNGIDAGRIRQSFPTIVGGTYLVSVGGSGVGVLIGTVAGTSDIVANVTNTIRPVFSFVAVGTTTWFNTLATANGATLDNVSVRQIIKDGSEMNSILPWTLTVAGTATATESPTGTLNLTGDGTNAANAEKVFSTVPGATYRVALTVTGQQMQVKVGTTSGGADVLAATTFVAGQSSFVFTATSASSYLRIFRLNTGANVTSAISVKLIAGAHASQPTSTKRPIYVSTAGGPGLQFDGVDDFLVTPTITPGTDSAQVFAGLRKLSDAARAIVVEHATGSGGIRLEAPNSAAANYASGSRGTLDPGAAVASGYAAPNAAVLAGLGVVSSDTNILRVNGAQVATQAGDQGTGNYAAGQVFIGMRAGTTLPASMVLNELVMRFGPTPDASRIAAMERYTNSKAVAF